MAECEEELKSLLMRVKDKSEKTGLKLNIQKKKTKQNKKTKKNNSKIMASSSITLWKIEG